MLLPTHIFSKSFRIPGSVVLTVYLFRLQLMSVFSHIQTHRHTHRHTFTHTEARRFHFIKFPVQYYFIVAYLAGSVKFIVVYPRYVIWGGGASNCMVEIDVNKVKCGR